MEQHIVPEGRESCYIHSGCSAPTILFYTEVSTIASQELLINEEIRDREVRLIDENGNQQGVVTLDVALRMAEEADLDLVKIAPQAVPPVCKIMDYGKYRFEQGKREKEQKKNQKVIEIKEIRLSATIDQHDMEVKAKACIKFLSDGNKVKVSIRFKGRQAKHGDIGLDVMNAFYEMVKDSAAVDRPAKQEGRNMFMILAPKAN
ncbi:MAG: translation initiation factor IF-3 [Christensenellales bacterium]